MSASSIAPSRPSRPANATLNSLNGRHPRRAGRTPARCRRCGRRASASGRGSPCRAGSAWSSGPSADGSPASPNEMPARVAGSAHESPSGLPRSQARLSKSPKTWQLAHDASPLLEVSARVVEDRPSRDDARPARVVQRDAARSRAARPCRPRHRVVEAGEHVEPSVRLVEHQAGGSAAADARCDRRRRARTCPARAPRCRRRRSRWNRRPRRRACCRRRVDRHADGRGEAAFLRARRARHDGVVDVLVQVARHDLGTIDAP